MIPAALSLRKRYGELNMPVTIFAGAADGIVDPDTHARQLHAQLPQSELHVLPSLGHMLHYAAVEQVVSSITTVESAARSAADVTLPASSLAA
jgi:pimeloyl-ACP methyl ester carboxylesterase